MTLTEIIKANQGTIVDVRSKAEFNGGHAEGSINIPLQEIEARMDEIKQLKQPLILCCASGGRSGQAFHFLSGKKIECINAGSWMDVHYLQTESI